MVPTFGGQLPVDASIDPIYIENIRENLCGTVLAWCSSLWGRNAECCLYLFTNLSNADHTLLKKRIHAKISV